MKAMVLPRLTDVAQDHSPLELVDLPIPVPHDQEILVELKSKEIRGAKVLRIS